MKPVSLTLEQLIGKIYDRRIRGLLRQWMVDHDMTMERLTSMSYEELKQQLDHNSIHALYLEAWSFVSNDLPWMKQLEDEQNIGRHK